MHMGLCYGVLIPIFTLYKLQREFLVWYRKYLKCHSSPSYMLHSKYWKFYEAHPNSQWTLNGMETARHLMVFDTLVTWWIKPVCLQGTSCDIPGMLHAAGWYPVQILCTCTGRLWLQLCGSAAAVWELPWDCPLWEWCLQEQGHWKWTIHSCQCSVLVLHSHLACIAQLNRLS